MRKVLCWSALAIAVCAAGCKKSDDKAKASPSTKKTVTIDAAVAKAAPLDGAVAAAAADAAPEAVEDGFDDSANRAGKKTGLGAAGEKPEVATEDLVAALAAGKLDAAALVDPAQGFIEHVILPGGGEQETPDIKKRRCGKDAAAALAKYAGSLVSEQQRWKELAAQEGDPSSAEHVIECDNQFVGKDDPDFGGEYADVDADKPTGGRPFRYADCRSGGAGEYDAAYELVFAPDPERGIRAVGVLVWEVGVANVPWKDFADAALKSGKNCK